MSDQRKIVEKHGGREMVVERGSFGATPPPGIRRSSSMVSFYRTHVGLVFYQEKYILMTVSIF